jgi:branched-chain amino acid transport system ATP-binding protein
MENNNILIAKNVSKLFGQLRAIDSVDLCVKNGEMLGIIGPNGSGKTTLINVITGFLRPDAGRVWFAGKEITGYPAYKTAKMGMARTFQIPRPLRGRPIKDTVMTAALFGYTGELPKVPMQSFVESCLASVGLEKKMNVTADDLTVQELKKLEFAKVLAARARLVFLDEVFAGLRPQEVDDMVTLVRRIWQERNITFIIIEHVMRAVMNLAERVVVLNAGKKIAEGTPLEIVENKQVLEVYLGTRYIAQKKEWGDQPYAEAF